MLRQPAYSLILSLIVLTLAPEYTAAGERSVTAFSPLPVVVAANEENRPRQHLKRKHTNPSGGKNSAKNSNENARIMRMEEEPACAEIRAASGDCKISPDPKTGGGGRQSPNPTPSPCIAVNMEEEPTGCE